METCRAVVPITGITRTTGLDYRNNHERCNEDTSPVAAVGEGPHLHGDGGVAETLDDVLGFEVWVVGGDLLRGHPVGDHRDN